MSRPTAGSPLAAPHLIVALLLAANTIAYLLCLRASGAPVIPAAQLVAAGALVPDALRPGERWRLVAAGFLHADPVHLLGNMLSLLIAGPVLERRLGATTFALVYGAALVGAGIVGLWLHPAPFVSVGASGAIFGVLGALFALWALGAEDLSAGFFLTNFALNAVLASRDPRIDWAAHIGGFVTGMATVALLDIASRANLLWLRCRFPDFVKAEAAILLLAGGAALWWHPPATVLARAQPQLALEGGLALAALALVKALDLLLSVRHGLAAAVLLAAAGNAALGWSGAGLALPALAQACASASALGALDGGVSGLLCPNLAVLQPVAAGLAAALTLLVLAHPLRRGLGDVGFVGATLMGDRRRHHGLVRPTRHTRA